MPDWTLVACFFLQLSLFPEFNTLSVMYGKPSFNFISQQVPYIITASDTSRGAGNAQFYIMY